MYDVIVRGGKVVDGTGAPGFKADVAINGDFIVAIGLRNPFRINKRPGTNEIWITDVGWSAWEEINRLVDPTGVVENFGWPCYEGDFKNVGFDSANLDLCESLYSGPPADLTDPYLPISHGTSFDPTECPGGGASISGLAFYESGHYPAAYEGALFFGDFSW